MIDGGIQLAEPDLDVCDALVCRGMARSDYERF